jgi:hypothetical protein
MTILFGPVSPGWPGAGIKVALPTRAANDNDSDLTRDGLLRAALCHFAEHGLGAAELAHRRAEQAYFAGDAKEYRHWLDICRALDRRLAATCAQWQEFGG